MTSVQITPSQGSEPSEVPAHEHFVAAVNAVSAPTENPARFVDALISAAVHLEKHMDHCRSRGLQVYPEVALKRAELQMKLVALLAPGTCPFDKLLNAQLGQLNSALIKLGAASATQAVGEELKERARKLAAMPIFSRK